MIVENLTGHGIDGISDLVTISLRDLCKAFALGKIATDDTVIALIGTALKAGIGVSIVDRETLIAAPIMLHAVAVLELRTIVNSDGLECALRVS